MDILRRRKFLNAITAFTHSFGFRYLDHLQPKGCIYMDPVQGLNLNRRSISVVEPEMLVTEFIKYHSLEVVSATDVMQNRQTDR